MPSTTSLKNATTYLYQCDGLEKGLGMFSDTQRTIMFQGSLILDNISVLLPSRILLNTASHSMVVEVLVSCVRVSTAGKARYKGSTHVLYTSAL